MATIYLSKLQSACRRAVQAMQKYWQSSRWHKVIVVAACLGVITFGAMYGIARWYIASQNGKPFTVGVSFIPAYAESLGLDPKQTMDALLTEAHVKHVRLVSYWDQLEPQQGHYDFRLLDWQFQKAEAAHAKITLSIGLRQPRWPECHMPAWASTMPASQWQPKLEAYTQAVVERYKDSPSLQSYQLENEYFLKDFGQCTDFSRDRLIHEYNLVKAADPNRPIILSRSNNVFGFPLGKPTPDEFGISVYKRVWSTPIGRYLEYPFPAWYYGFLAGVQKITTGKDSMIHELQAEPWPPQGKSVTEISLQEQNKSFDAQRFKDRIQLGKSTGMHEMYLWGGEYWYYRKTVLHDDSVWNVAKQIFEQNRANAQD